MQCNGFTASRLISEIGLFFLYFLIFFGLFSNRLIFEGRPIFEEIQYTVLTRLKTFGSGLFTSTHCNTRKFSVNRQLGGKLVFYTMLIVLKSIGTYPVKSPSRITLALEMNLSQKDV